MAIDEATRALLADRLAERDTIYTAVFSAVAASAAQDLFELVAPADKWVRIHGLWIGQYSDAGDAQAELLSMTFKRGNTSSGSGGSSVTPRPLRSWGPAAGSTLEANNTTPASGGSPHTLWAESWNIQAPFVHYPSPAQQIILAPSERLVATITAPADGITANGTLLFEELAARPGN